MCELCSSVEKKKKSAAKKGGSVVLVGSSGQRSAGEGLVKKRNHKQANVSSLASYI